MSPLPSDSHTSSPKSTESEQSQALDPSEPSPELAFTHFGLSTGIMHRSEDMYDALPSYFPDEHCTSDLTMTETFGMKYGDFGDITGLGDNAASQLGLTNLFDKLSAPAVAQHASADVDLQSVYAALGWTLPTAVEPQLISPPTPLKRKVSDSSDESALAKRPRGRPPKPRPDAKRPRRRQSKGGSSVPALVAAAVLDTPTSRSVTFADIDGSDHESVVAVGKKAGKSSTARPKSVVPEKYLKDGSAQTMLGMSVDQIQSFPTFEELLKMVSSSLRPGAAEFGERIKENRDKAKDAAKKSRDERRAKIDSLEKTVAELEGTIEGMRGVLATLVTKGLLDQGEMAVWL